MLITEAEVRVLLGLMSTITDAERALLTLVVPAACGKVIEHLGYNPEQGERTELLPRVEVSGGAGLTSDNLDWKLSGNRAVPFYEAGRCSTLQLTHLPVRSVTSVYADEAANHGQASGAFAAATLQTKGTDYWVEFDEPYSGDVNKGLCKSGCLFSNGAWPQTPGTVKVTYRAGYSSDELRGRASADATVSDVITQANVNASGIHRAALITAIKAFHTWIAYQKDSTLGFTGPMSSESMGDYSYSGGSGAGSTDLTIALPPEAVQELEPFVNWGAKLRG